MKDPEVANHWNELLDKYESGEMEDSYVSPFFII